MHPWNRSNRCEKITPLNILKWLVGFARKDKPNTIRRAMGLRRGTRVLAYVQDVVLRCAVAESEHIELNANRLQVDEFCIGRPKKASPKCKQPRQAAHSIDRDDKVCRSVGLPMIHRTKEAIQPFVLKHSSGSGRVSRLTASPVTADLRSTWIRTRSTTTRSG
jgi:hypothetical protein